MIIQGTIFRTILMISNLIIKKIVAGKAVVHFFDKIVFIACILLLISSMQSQYLAISSLIYKFFR